jgi:PhoD-like phosphatase
MTGAVRPVDEWGLVLVGPMVRRVTPETVAVFVALREAATVWLDIYAGVNPSGDPTHVRLGDDAAAVTTALGRNLHVAVIESLGLPLEQGVVYGYDLRIATVGGAGSLGLGDLGFLDGDVPLGYTAGLLPGFVLPAGRADLRFVHASCRKAHGGGPDMLATVDALIATDVDDAWGRPQQLFLTGDQIYADDVAQGLLTAYTEAAGLLLDWAAPEALPDDSGALVVFPDDDLVAPGERSAYLDLLGFKDATFYADNHLLFLGDWYAAYCMAWSDELWVRSARPDVAYELPKTGLFGRDAATLEAEAFATRLPNVRRALANVATYMLCDDHEVTDDWYLNQRVSQRTRSSVIGRRIVRNALAGYAVFQDWGNRPDDYLTGQFGATILGALRAGTGTSTQPISAPAILGSPATLDATFDINPGGASDGHRKRWDFQVLGPEHQVIFLDTRTWRSYPDVIVNPERNCALVSETSQRFQLDDRLTGRDPNMALFVVSPAPVIGMWFVEMLQKLKIVAAPISAAEPLHGEPLHGSEEMDNEPWAGDRASFDAFLERLCPFGPVVFLSGDVHYAFSQVSTYSSPMAMGRFIQLVSSSTKNSDNLTNLLSVSELLTGPLTQNLWLSGEEISRFFDQQSPDFYDRAVAWAWDHLHDWTDGLPDPFEALSRMWTDLREYNWNPISRQVNKLPELFAAGAIEYDQLGQLLTLMGWNPQAIATIHTVALIDDRSVSDREAAHPDLASELGALSGEERLGTLERNRGSLGVSNIGVVSFDQTSEIEEVVHQLVWRRTPDAVDPSGPFLVTEHRAQMRQPLHPTDTADDPQTLP